MGGGGGGTRIFGGSQGGGRGVGRLEGHSQSGGVQGRAEHMNRGPNFPPPGSSKYVVSQISVRDRPILPTDFKILTTLGFGWVAGLGHRCC